MSNLSYTLDFNANTAPIRAYREQLQGLGSAIRGVLAAGGSLAIAAKLREGLAAGLHYNSKMEEIRRSLAAVTGSAARASLRIDELNKLEGQSRFDVAELSEASRQLQVMTDGALAAGKGFQMVADVAAGTNTPLASTTDALGRVYGQIQAGDQELGRGLQQLVMMGAINASVKNSIEALAKSGGSAQQTWSALADALGRFSGQAKASVGTLQGQLFQLKQAFEEAAGAATRNLFAQLQPALASLTGSLRQNGARESIVAIGGALGTLAGKLAKMGAELANCAPLWASLTAAVKAFAAIKLVHLLGDLQAWISKVWNGVAATTASTAAITAETRALAANAAARRVSNLALPFAPPTLPALDKGLRDPRTGRFRVSPQATGFMHTATYTTDQVTATLVALEAQRAGATAGQKFASWFKSQLTVTNLVAGTLGWEIGSALGEKYVRNRGKTDPAYSTDQQFGAAEDSRRGMAVRTRGLLEELAALDSVERKYEIIEQIKKNIREMADRAGDSTVGALEKNQIGMAINTLTAMQGLFERTSNFDLADRRGLKEAGNRLVNDRPAQAAFEKSEATKNAEAFFEDRLEAAETYAEKLRIVQAELEKTKSAIARLNSLDVKLYAGEEGFAQQKEALGTLEDKRRALERQQAGLGRENKKDSTDKATRMEEYQLELKILNLRNAGNETGARAAEQELAIRKKTADLEQIARDQKDKDLAPQRAKEFVEAELLAKRPQPTGAALMPQADRFARVGLFVGGVPNSIAQRGAAASEKAAQTLRQIYDVIRSQRSASPAAVWGD